MARKRAPKYEFTLANIHQAVKTLEDANAKSDGYYRVPIPGLLAPIGAAIKVVLIETSEFIVIGPEHQIWTTPSGRWDELSSSFVRVIPPPTATDEDIERVTKWAQSAGPLLVDVKPRPKTQVVVRQAEPNTQTSKSIRQVVEAMTDEANSKNPPLLKEIVQTVLGRVGL
jgi:hypothetical protein